jgi:[protein-PII] uridylyltransferase
LLDKRRNERTFQRHMEVERLPTVLRFDQETSSTRTIIEVETEDRVGLLYTISHVLSDLGLDISTAKICTEKGAAVDAFYVSEFQGSKITEPVRLQAVERAIRQAIEWLDAPKPLA